ncbi:4-hydroxythreonine-4-phosphate dehydrogenase PdxA [Legionella dresdenensis]|uniref:4-hydroxythreonine-4-phosphate dehydrogenase n=1 Tax=Legionella dresdenensis TaxID=450200 RepID=A0ABV8CFH8_9GAMM
MKPVLVTSGEPAGIGPDICLPLAESDLPIVVIGNKQVLQERADKLGLTVELVDYDPDQPYHKKKNVLPILSLPCAVDVIPGKLEPNNASHVLAMLDLAASLCLQNQFSALVTAPVNKAVINQAGFPFTGHTEFFADKCGVETVVMMLACKTMRVALVTTHLPIQKVPSAITQQLIIDVILKLHYSLQQDFGIAQPVIHVAGLNPHAGEGGYLGREEIDTISPALAILRSRNINVTGPYPADTMFAQSKRTNIDAFVAMYHDQGLPVLKYAGFGQAVNITLGLPIIRTSVDHGTALELAGTGNAEHSSLFFAVETAFSMADQRNKYD